jgi:protein SCO1
MEDPNSNDYQVLNGITFFLLNPQGELQAIFRPDNQGTGAHSFDPDKLATDYLAIRQYLTETASAGAVVR